MITILVINHSYFLQNFEQLLHGLHHSMYIDPCRRFTLGATIDNTSMRLWLYTRSMIVVSEPFNFKTVGPAPYQFVYIIY